MARKNPYSIRLGLFSSLQSPVLNRHASTPPASEARHHHVADVPITLPPTVPRDGMPHIQHRPRVLAVSPSRASQVGRLTLSTKPLGNETHHHVAKRPPSTGGSFTFTSLAGFAHTDLD